MSKTLKERVNNILSCNRGIIRCTEFPLNTWNNMLDIIEEQQARIAELESKEITEAEIEAAAEEIKYAESGHLGCGYYGILEPKEAAKSALEAARKARLGNV